MNSTQPAAPRNKISLQSGLWSRVPAECVSHSILRVSALPHAVHTFPRSELVGSYVALSLNLVSLVSHRGTTSSACPKAGKGQKRGEVRSRQKDPAVLLGLEQTDSQSVVDSGVRGSSDVTTCFRRPSQPAGSDSALEQTVAAPI